MLFIATVIRKRKCHQCEIEMPRGTIYGLLATGNKEQNICAKCLLTVTIHLLNDRVNFDVDNNHHLLPDDLITDKEMKRFKQIFMEKSIG